MVCGWSLVRSSSSRDAFLTKATDFEWAWRSFLNNTRTPLPALFPPCLSHRPPPFGLDVGGLRHGVRDRRVKAPQIGLPGAPTTKRSCGLYCSPPIPSGFGQCLFTPAFLPFLMTRINFQQEEFARTARSTATQRGKVSLRPDPAGARHRKGARQCWGPRQTPRPCPRRRRDRFRDRCEQPAADPNRSVSGVDLAERLLEHRGRPEHRVRRHSPAREDSQKRPSSHRRVSSVCGLRARRRL